MYLYTSCDGFVHDAYGLCGENRLFSASIAPTVTGFGGEEKLASTHDRLTDDPVI